MNTVAPQALNEVKPKVVEPKQVKLLGATVKGVGVVTAVSSTLPFCYALIEDDQGREHRRLLVSLKRGEVEFPGQLQPFATRVERVAYGLW